MRCPVRCIELTVSCCSVLAAQQAYHADRMLNKDNLLTDIFISCELGWAGLRCHLAGIHGPSSTELARPVHVPAVQVVADTRRHGVHRNLGGPDTVRVTVGVIVLLHPPPRYLTVQRSPPENSPVIKSSSLATTGPRVSTKTPSSYNDFQYLGIRIIPGSKKLLLLEIH